MSTCGLEGSNKIFLLQGQSVVREKSKINYKYFICAVPENIHTSHVRVFG